MAKTVDKHINIWVNGNQVENNMKSIQQAIKHVTNQLRLSTIGSKEYIEASKKLNPTFSKKFFFWTIFKGC